MMLTSWAYTNRSPGERSIVLSCAPSWCITVYNSSQYSAARYNNTKECLNLNKVHVTKGASNEEVGEG